MRIAVPAERVITAPCDLVVEDLQPAEVVTVTIRCDYGRAPSGGGRVFEAVGEFAADHKGRVELVGAAPRGGSWVGDASGMGPWWSATRVGTASSPIAGDAIPTTAAVVADGRTETAVWTRRRLASPVRKAERTHAIARTVTWLPAGEEPRAGLVVLGGSGGGMPPEAGWSTLASFGVAVCRSATSDCQDCPAR